MPCDGRGDVSKSRSIFVRKFGLSDEQKNTPQVDGHSGRSRAVQGIWRAFLGRCPSTSRNSPSQQGKDRSLLCMNARSVIDQTVV